MAFRVKDGRVVRLEEGGRRQTIVLSMSTVEYRLGLWSSQRSGCLRGGGIRRRWLLVPPRISSTERCHWSRKEKIANRSRATAATAPTRLSSLHAGSSSRSGIVLSRRPRFCPDVAIATSTCRIDDAAADRRRGTAVHFESFSQVHVAFSC